MENCQTRMILLCVASLCYAAWIVWGPEAEKHTQDGKSPTQGPGSHSGPTQVYKENGRYKHLSS